MILKNAIDLWEYIHAPTTYFENISIHSSIDKQELKFYLMREFNDMECLSSSSTEMHNMVINFFKIHESTINKLAQSLALVYNPLDTFNETENRDIGESRGSETESTNHLDHARAFQDSTVEFVSAFNALGGVNVGTPPDIAHSTFDDTEKSRNVDEISEKYTDDTTHNSSTNLSLTRDDDVTRKGHSDKFSYQSLVEEERRVAMFNLYRWIADKFCSELLVGIW